MKNKFLFGLLLVSFSLAAQSPWPRSKAGFFVQASWNTIPTYTTLFGPDGKDIVLERAVSEQNFQLYGHNQGCFSYNQWVQVSRSAHWLRTLDLGFVTK